MTNTKFRKRALLSSVAMLLVALVALGSATFAWFVANPTATASGLTMTTQAAPGIAVASNSVIGLKGNDESYVDAYKASTFLNAKGESIATAAAKTASDVGGTFDLQPASPFLTLSSGALTFGAIDASSAAAEALDTAKTWRSETAIYSEKIYLKTSTTGSGDTATVNSAKVAITLNSSTNITAKNGVKVALVSSEGELIGIWKPTAGDASQTWTGSTSAVGSAGLTTGTAYGYSASDAWKNLATPIAVNSTIDNTGKTSKWVEVYVYLDGENTGVFSDNIPDVTTLVTGITVSVSTATQS